LMHVMRPGRAASWRPPELSSRPAQGRSRRMASVDPTGESSNRLTSVYRTVDLTAACQTACCMRAKLGGMLAGRCSPEFHGIFNAARPEVI
jgi:hypothetical protein